MKRKARLERVAGALLGALLAAFLLHLSRPGIYMRVRPPDSSPASQRLKVRVVEELAPWLGREVGTVRAGGTEAAWRKALSLEGELARRARGILREGEVRVREEKVGNLRGLVVEWGEGRGSNWWCLVYPYSCPVSPPRFRIGELLSRLLGRSS
jgi:hypothetical protein